MKAKEIIDFFEGKRLKVYLDSGGLKTVGIGHLLPDNTLLKVGDKITLEQCDRFFAEDYQEAELRVNKHIYIPLNEYEKAAVISQAFNLKSFPQLASHLNKDKNLYKRRMLLYCHDAVKKVKLNGLLIRRICERLLFEGKDWKKIATELQRENNLEYTNNKMRQLFYDL